MRHEHERTDGQDASFLASLPDKDMARESAGKPSARDTSQKHEEDFGSFIILLQTLVTPLPPRSALPRALSLGLNLLPAIRALSLFTLPDGTRGSLTLASSVERTQDGAEPAAHDLWQRRPSLGLGELIDQQTLEGRTRCRKGRVTTLPLLSPTMGLIGALVAEEREQGRGRERLLLLDALAYCLTILLERLLSEETASRRARALTTMGELAARAQEPHTSTGASERMGEAILRDTASTLHALTLPLTSVALAPAMDGALRTISAGEDISIEIEPVRGAELLAALRGRVALVASATHERGIWDDLVALRDQARQRTGLDVERLTLLPVRVEGAVKGILVLVHAAGGLDERYWMPEANAVMVVAGMSLYALRLAEAAAEETRVRDEFISLAAHELRNPLTSIKGYAQLLARQAGKTAVPDAMLRSMEAIQQQSLRMSEMVGELLDASRIRRGVLDVQPRRTELVPLTQRLIEKRQAQYPQHVIVLQIEEPSLVGEWDAQRVEQIVGDLLDNAARYSPESGTITIRLARADDMALLSVVDQGIGVAPEDRSHIFDYLYRAPRAEERNLSGLGLGLYISHYLAERMGGRLVLYETATGKAHGSEFRLLLPLE